MLQRGPQQNRPGTVRAPAIVTEFLSQGSLRAVLSRKSDVISGPLVRVLIAMDAAKVLPPHLPSGRCSAHRLPSLLLRPFVLAPYRLISVKHRWTSLYHPYLPRKSRSPPLPLPDLSSHYDTPPPLTAGATHAAKKIGRSSAELNYQSQAKGSPACKAASCPCGPAYMTAAVLLLGHVPEMTAQLAAYKDTCSAALPLWGYVLLRFPPTSSDVWGAMRRTLDSSSICAPADIYVCRCLGAVHVQGMEYLHSKKIVHFDLKVRLGLSLPQPISSVLVMQALHSGPAAASAWLRKMSRES